MPGWTAEVVLPAWTGWLGVLVVASGLAAVVWAKFQSDAKDITERRLRAENEDYLRRLNYLEPHATGLEQRVKVLESLHAPTEAIEGLRRDIANHHREVMRLLGERDKGGRDDGR